jgi:hypothetical protein
MVEATSEFVYIAPIVVGLACGFLELIFVHEDEPGMGWVGHGMHALPFCILFSFLSMNIGYIYKVLNLGFTSNFTYDIAIRAVLGLIAAFKIKSAAAVTKGHSSVGEKLPHALLIGAIIAASPYVWPIVVNTGIIPEFLQK